MKGVETTCVLVTQREAHEVERKKEGKEKGEGREGRRKGKKEQMVKCTRYKMRQMKPGFC